MSDQVAPGKITAQVASRGTLVKLTLFSVSLGVVPISAYFASLKYVFAGNSMYAAIAAVVAANVVLVAYIISSIADDKAYEGKHNDSVTESKKSR